MHYARSTMHYAPGKLNDTEHFYWLLLPLFVKCFSSPGYSLKGQNGIIRFCQQEVPVLVVHIHVFIGICAWL